MWSRRGPKARRPALALALALLALSVRAAAAPGSGDVQRALKAANRLYESLEYEKALEELQRARALSPAPEEEVEILLYEGIIHADLSHREKSQAAFRAALQLQWDARLPVRVSPKVERDFEQLRKQVVQEQARTRRAPPAKSGPSTAQPSGPPPSPPSDRPVASRPPARLVPAPTPAPAPFSTPMTPEVFGVRVPMASAALGGGAVAAGVGGVVFGILSRSSLAQAQQATFQDEAYMHWQDASRTAPLANGLFIGAGVLAGGAVATYFLLPKE